MADESAVARRLGELWQWVSSAVTAPPAPPPPPPGSAEIARVADEIAKIDARIVGLREAIDAETARIQAEAGAYCHAGARMPNATRISVKAMLRRRGQLERTLHQAYEMHARLNAHLHGLENATTQRAFVTVLRETQATPHGHLTDYDVRAAEDAMEEQRELDYRAAEFHGVVAARGLGDVDDADVEEELACILETRAAPVLPDAVRDPPAHAPAAPAAARHRELDELADFM